jgi:alpha-1,2-mannosyltransferase
LFFLVLPILGGIVEMRSAFLMRRMGDLDCFLRAGWAVRTGSDLYSVTSDNDWHYNYPPLYAILMAPLADPPRGIDNAGYLPYSVSVGICFALNLLCLFVSVHVLASAIEERTTLADQPRFCLRWWALRMLPVFVCITPIGHTLVRGQVNLVILAALCLALAGWIRGQNYRAGLWLSLAICIKVIPAFLLLYPLWKRDGKALAGCAVGCVVGLGLVPLLTFGPAKMVTHYETYGRVFFGPFLKITSDDSRKEEILGGVNSTESVGVRNAIHNWMFPDVATRPPEVTLGGKIAYLVLGVAMTFVTLWPRRDGATNVAMLFGGLILLMTIFSPVCHSHYLLFCVPIVMALMAHFWQDQATVRVPWWITAMNTAFVATMAIAYLPGLEILKDRCATLFATLPLWAGPIWLLWRRVPTAVAVEPAQELRRAA